MRCFVRLRSAGDVLNLRLYIDHTLAKICEWQNDANQGGGINPQSELIGANPTHSKEREIGRSNAAGPA